MATPAGPSSPDPQHFPTAATFRRWLLRYHASTTELWVGFYKQASGRGGMGYVEAVEQALCFGWIDGVVRGVDNERYAQRFTPRKPRSNWSAINLRRYATLDAAGQVAPAGLELDRDEPLPLFAVDRGRAGPEERRVGRGLAVCVQRRHEVVESAHRR